MAKYIENQEYVDKETILNELEQILNDVNCPIFVAATVDQIILDSPAADVAPVVHGQWKENDNFDDGFWVCSSCGFVSEATAAHKLYKFCPNCGADMREE